MFVGVRVEVGVFVDVRVNVGVFVGVRVGVGVFVAVFVGVRVDVGVLVDVLVGVFVGVRVGVDVFVGVRLGVSVKVEVGGMKVPVGVALLVKVIVGVLVLVGVKVAVAVAAAVGDEIGEAVGEADASTVGVAVAGVRVKDGNCVGSAVGVIGELGGSLKQATGENAIQSSGARGFHLPKKPRRGRLPVGGCIRSIAIDDSTSLRFRGRASRPSPSREATSRAAPRNRR